MVFTFCQKRFNEQVKNKKKTKRAADCLLNHLECTDRRTVSSSSFGNNVKYLSTIFISVLSAGNVSAAVYDSSKLIS